MDTINGFFQNYYGDGIFLILACLSAVYLVIAHASGGKMRSPWCILAPSAFLLLIILNPWLYNHVFVKIVYWRLFWLIPGGLITAWALADLIGRFSGSTGKWAVFTAAAALLICLSGRNIFHTRLQGMWLRDYGYVKADNAYHVSKAMKDIGDIMLSRKDHPSCVLPEPMFIEARQYSGDIETYYGRDVLNMISWTTDEKRVMYQAMESDPPDYNAVFSKAADTGLDFVVTRSAAPVEDGLPEQYGYGSCAETDGYCVYQKQELK